MGKYISDFHEYILDTLIGIRTQKPFFQDVKFISLHNNMTRLHFFAVNEI